MDETTAECVSTGGPGFKYVAYRIRCFCWQVSKVQNPQRHTMKYWLVKNGNFQRNLIISNDVWGTPGTNCQTTAVDRSLFKSCWLHVQRRRP